MIKWSKLGPKLVETIQRERWSYKEQVHHCCEVYWLNLVRDEQVGKGWVECVKVHEGLYCSLVFSNTWQFPYRKYLLIIIRCPDHHSS